MSGYSGGGGSGDGQLDSLLAGLRRSNNGNGNVNIGPNLAPASGYGYAAPIANAFGQSQYNGSQSYHQPSVASAMPTPPVYNNHPHHPSAIMSPVETPHGHSHPQAIPAARGGAPNPDRTSSLLNLLKFTQATSSSPRQSAPIGTPLPPSRESSMSFPRSDIVGQVSAQDHGHSGSDLLAALMGSTHSSHQPRPSPQTSAPRVAPFSSSETPTSPSTETQNYLLSLLNPNKKQQSDATPVLRSASLTPANVYTPTKTDNHEAAELAHAPEESPIEEEGLGSRSDEDHDKENRSPSIDSRNITPLPKANANLQPGLFTYVNPFDQLAESSPRVRTPKNGTPGPSAAPAQSIHILKRDAGDSKRTRERHSPNIVPLSNKRKLVGESQVSSGPPTPLPTEGQYLIDMLQSSGSKETVADALNDIGEIVDKEVEEAIARAEQDNNQVTIKQELDKMLSAENNEAFEESAQVLAQHVQVELVKEENEHALDMLPTPEAEEVIAIVDAIADGHIADVEDVVDSWESADAEDTPTKVEKEAAVKVYNFPMRPWTSITINPLDSIISFKETALMDIARLKKEFDQIDRTLVTASNHFIVYGMSKNGGIRIIRQDDGKDGRLFTETHDRIFSVATSSSSADLKESILGTGVSGTVYWALVKDGDGDHIEDGALEMHGFALPPIQSLEGDAPGGGVLKTRARKSSSHPDFFAVGRGKSIHIIWPATVMKSYLKIGKDRMADAEKYLLQNSFKVNTGKAGKDFIFSADDSIIASLDKSGRVKFWDVRTLTKSDGRGNPAPENKHPIEIKEPILTFVTTPATEKSWPTSVLFVDKARPYQKGGALRYVIIGMKQNHTLQLWDLALQKPVQEIHLPHNKESDAVCSVLYHAATGMIVVGHPTRNSIYFLHLSAPKYNLGKSTQAEYLEKLAAKDPTLPKPESTAVISGMREYSFDSRGSLRSLDMLQTPSPSSHIKGEPETQFELYAMHSKGVTCISIKQVDLGWTLDNKVINPVSGEETRTIAIEQLKEIPVIVEEVPLPQVALPIRGTSRSNSTKEITQTPKKTSHGEASSSVASVKVEEKVEKKESISTAATNGSSEKQRSGTRRNRKATASASMENNASGSTAAGSSKVIVMDPNSHSRNGTLSKAVPEVESITQPKQSSATAQPFSTINDASLKDLESRITEQVKKAIKTPLDNLSNDLKSDRRTQTLQAGANSEALLKLVSATLEDNLTGVIQKVVATGIEESVVPALSAVTLKAVSEQVNDQLSSMLTSQLNKSIPKAFQDILPHAISKALQNAEVLSVLCTSLAKTVAFNTEEKFTVMMQKTVIPAVVKSTEKTLERVAEDIQRQAASQITTLKQQHEDDNLKIEKLMQLVTGLTETVSTMAASQAEFQGKVLSMQETASKQRELTREGQSSVDSSSAKAGASLPSQQSSAPKRSPPQTAEDMHYQNELRVVVDFMETSNYDGACLRWLQSGFVQRMFKDYFAKVRPEFVRELNTIMLLSVGAKICEEIEDQEMTPRVAYVDMITQVLQNHIVNGGDMVRAEFPQPFFDTSC